MIGQDIGQVNRLSGYACLIFWDVPVQSFIFAAWFPVTAPRAPVPAG
jgi:hypothetical protein